jgi:hypothetical protein
MDIKGNKILCNIKIWWIFITSFVKFVLSKYYVLLVKMALDAPIIPFAKFDFVLLIHMETLLGLNTVMPPLKVVHSLISNTNEGVFVRDFITIIKICEADVYHMYCDNQTYFEGDAFIDFTNLIYFIHENISFH